MRIALLMPALLLPHLVFAQTIQSQAYNRWLVEQGDYEARPTARIAGVVRYNRYAAHATLAFYCVAPRGNLELTFDPQKLAFNSDPYEGPSATMNGPVTVTVGAQGTKAAADKTAPIQLKVGGYFNDASPYDTGTPFVLSAFPEQALLQAWAADAMRGQALHFSVPAASGAPLEAEFRWPDDNQAYKDIMAQCLTAPNANQPAKP